MCLFNVYPKVIYLAGSQSCVIHDLRELTTTYSRANHTTTTGLQLRANCSVEANNLFERHELPA